MAKRKSAVPSKERIIVKPDHKEVDLIYPITLIKDDQKIITESVIIKRIKLKHLRALPKEIMEKLSDEEQTKKSMTIDEAVPLLVAVTSLTEEEINELDVTDFQRIQEVMNSEDFL